MPALFGEQDDAIALRAASMLQKFDWLKLYC